MDSYSENTHPDSELLARYIESPETSQHKPVRQHLMACDHCRLRVDKLVQLEIDIKHYVPRLNQHRKIDDLDENEQHIERYIDDQLSPEESQSVKQQLDSSQEALKAALHYAVHSAAMNRNIDSTNTNVNKKAYEENKASYLFGSFFNNLLQYLQWPTPAWAMAPAVLLFATAISLSLMELNSGQQKDGPFIAKFQDNAVISYSSADIPKGSIGFFHDAKSSTEPFSGMNIIVKPDQSLDFNWQAIAKAKSYEFKVYEFNNGQKRELTTLTSNEPSASPENIAWENEKHYQWQLGGVTQDGLHYTTSGDFIFIHNNSD
jgi:hypothetical protein